MACKLEMSLITFYIHCMCINNCLGFGLYKNETLLGFTFWQTVLNMIENKIVAQGNVCNPCNQSLKFRSRLKLPYSHASFFWFLIPTHTQLRKWTQWYLGKIRLKLSEIQPSTILFLVMVKCLADVDWIGTEEPNYSKVSSFHSTHSNVEIKQ